MGSVKGKALFMIVLIAFTSFTFYIPDIRAQQQECCERTRDGAFCMYTDASQCDPPFKKAPAFCEDTSFCTLGCCFDSDSGECFSNTAYSECTQLDGTWKAGACTDTPQCSVGCCQLENQAFLSTLTKCKQVVSQYSDSEPDFDASIQDEFTCVNSVLSAEQGCCVKEDSCSFTTRADCGLLEPRPTTGNETNKGPETQDKSVGFYPEILCSSDSLVCTGAKQHHLGCYNEDVYWFDSESNRENIFLGYSPDAKRESYNNGKVLEEPGCVASPYDPRCGNCDYTKGTLCAEVDGNPTCIDLNCKDITPFPHAPDVAGSKELGESWCIFDGPVGFAQDTVGSRHFRGVCINGEEVIEPCRDFREEFCTQSVSGGEPMTQFGSFYQKITSLFTPLKGRSALSDIFSGSSYSEGACRENRFQSCLDCNEFGTRSEVFECCNEQAYRDCYFLPSGATEKEGTCVPNVPPGLRFWSDAASILERQTTSLSEEGKEQKSVERVPSVPGDDHCRQANFECEVGFSRTEFSDWKCTSNCHCLTEDMFAAVHSVCIAQGDCGSYMNYVEEFTQGGWNIDATGPKGKDGAIPSQFKEKLIQRLQDDLQRNALVNPPEEGKKPKELGGFKGFFKKSAVPLSIIGGTGLVGALTSGQLSSFVGGLILGPTYALGGLSYLVGGAGTPSQALVSAGFKSPFVKELVLNSGNTLPKGLALTGGEVEKLGLKGVEGIKALEGGGYKVVESGIKVPSGIDPKGVTIPGQGAATSFGHVLGIVNIISWAWTIYNIIDVLGAETVTGKVKFECLAWEAPDGGADCEKCNKGPLPCSEYRCKSLGKACSIVNEGTDNVLCVNILPQDTNSPRIIADTEFIKYGIQEEKLNGFTITNPLPPFTPVSLALLTDEPAQCKFSSEPSIEYDDMNFNFGSSLFEFKHNMTISLPSELQSDQALQLTNGGKYTLYVRCVDANGNENERDYYIRFQIDKGPDLTPPKIESTSINSGSFIKSDIESVLLDLYLNEPSQCKWDKRDIEIDLMEHSFICGGSGLDIQGVNFGSYGCSASLDIEHPTGNSSENKENGYYFRCQDKAGNKNFDSFNYKLISTHPLRIGETSPNGTLTSGIGIELKITTLDGAENGKAICGVSTENIPFRNMAAFQTTNMPIHTQTLQLLEEGAYTFFVICLDTAGNEAKTRIDFSVEPDDDIPILFSVFKDTNLGILSITTNEPTTCRYLDQDFPFERGILMTNEDTLTHEAVLGNTLYIVKCRDIFDNEATFTIFP